MPGYSWTQPLQVNAARPEHQGRRAKYGAPVLAAFTLLGRSRAPMPHDADGASMKQGSDSSPRLRLLSSRGTPLPGQTVSATEGEPPPPGRPGHSRTYRRIRAADSRVDRIGPRAHITPFRAAPAPPPIHPAASPPKPH